MPTKTQMVEPAQMLNAVMANIYEVLTSGDENTAKSEDNFFSWCTPGIPLDPSELQFLTQGLTGVIKAKPGENLAEQDPALLETLKAQDTTSLYAQAENFARLVDFVPDINTNTNDQFAAMSVMSNEGTLSDRYQYILKMSQVMETELPEKTKAKIDKFRGLLTTTREKVNIITDEVEEITEPSALVNLYQQKLTAYGDAVLEYNTHRIAALAGDDSKAVHFWSLNGNVLRNKVKAAMNDWISNGYKLDYEGISAYINQVSQRDMALLKANYQDELEKARLTGIASGGDFYYTSCVPANFMESSGWTNFSFKNSHYERNKESSYTYNRSKKGGGAGYLGIFGVGGSKTNSSGTKESTLKFNRDRFEISFDMAQVQIVRSNWFKPSFLNSKLWRFDENNPQAKGQMVSDGAQPPQGLIPAYPTAMIVIKNLRIKMHESEGLRETQKEWESSKAKGGGAIHFGPFSIGGGGSGRNNSGSKSSDYNFDSKTGEITVPGHQIIGFKCHIQPKSPNPLSSIEEWI